MAKAFREIITFKPNDADEKILIPASDLFGCKELYYTMDEYKLHLENIENLLEHNKDYGFEYIEDEELASVTICGKEDVGVLITKDDLMSTAFAFREQNITAAFWTYLKTVK